MEYLQGKTLLDLISRNPFDEDTARRYFRQLVSAVSFIHAKHHIIHRDLKDENILVTPDESTVKIIDWGMATKFSDSSFLHSDCGSPHYAAPEIFKRQPYRGPEVDVWCLGVILYTMVSGCFPFHGKKSIDVAYLVTKAKYEPLGCSPELEELLQRIFVVSPEHRISLPEISQHPWLKSVQLSSPHWKNLQLNRRLLLTDSDPSVVASLKVFQPHSSSSPSPPVKRKNAVLAKSTFRHNIFDPKQPCIPRLLSLAASGPATSDNPSLQHPPAHHPLLLSASSNSPYVKPNRPCFSATASPPLEGGTMPAFQACLIPVARERSSSLEETSPTPRRRSHTHHHRRLRRKHKRGKKPPPPETAGTAISD